jgi:hypothetical protein
VLRVKLTLSAICRACGIVPVDGVEVTVGSGGVAAAIGALAAAGATAGVVDGIVASDIGLAIDDVAIWLLLL